MYPAELEIKDTTESNTSAAYLDLLLSIESDGQLRTSLYDKRDNSTPISQTFPSWVAIFHLRQPMVFLSHSSYGMPGLAPLMNAFILRAARLSSKLLGQGYVMERLKSSLMKFYGRYGDLIKNYAVSLYQMLHEILGHDHIQWHPQLIRHYTNVRPYYRTLLYYIFWPYYQILEVSIEHCNGYG